MGLIFRGTKGSALTHNELDNNFREFVYSGSVEGSTGTFSGRLLVDDATEATSTTDGSLQTDGGLSVAKSAVVVVA